MDLLNVLAKFEIRSFSHSRDNRGYRKKLGSPWICPRSLFSKKFNGLLFGWTPWMYWPNLKSVAFPVPEIIGGTGQKMGSPWIRPHSLFSKNFNGLLFGWTPWMYWPNLKSAAFPVPEIIGGTGKNWAVPGYAHAPFSPKIIMGFCSDGPPESTGLLAKFEIRSFSRSWDNRGYRKKMGSPWIRPHSLFSKILMGFCLDGPSECTGKIWSS